MIKKVLLSSGALVATIALSGSMAFAGTISTTGKGSVNVIANGTISLCSSTNNNNPSVNTLTGQQSKTGNASVTKNTNAKTTTGGNAMTGAASNGSINTLKLTVANTSPCNTVSSTDNSGTDPSSIDTTGNKSVNVVATLNFSATKSVNNNNLWVGTTTLQGAQSGNATVSGNTNGGNATSGNSTNTSSNTLTLSVTNN